VRTVKGGSVIVVRLPGEKSFGLVTPPPKPFGQDRRAQKTPARNVGLRATAWLGLPPPVLPMGLLVALRVYDDSDQQRGLKPPSRTILRLPARTVGRGGACTSGHIAEG
jgi:hypothetical protein